MYKTIDLCAGIGGIRRGFELTGMFNNVLSAEIDEYAARTYEHLYGENPRNDLTSEEFKLRAEEADYDVLLAGFPCQAFSSAGLQLGFEDKIKGTIFFDIAEIVNRTSPKAIFLENVQNLLSHDKKKTISTILNVLEKDLNYKVIGVKYDAGGELIYTADSFKRNTKRFGLPQNRPRVYIMAFSRSIYGNKVEELINELPYSSGITIFESVDDIVDEHVSEHYYMSSQYLQTLINHKARQKSNGNGYGYCVVNSEDRTSRVANTIMATGGSGKERNLILQPVEEYKGIKVSGKISPLNDKGIRVMTPTEWGRLQGFVGYGFVNSEGVDEFSFPDGMTEGQKYKQFGNSVSIPVIRTMAEFMLNEFEILNSDPIYLIERMVRQKKVINRQDIIKLLRVDPQRATYLLRIAVANGLIQKSNNGRNAEYRFIEV